MINKMTELKLNTRKFLKILFWSLLAFEILIVLGDIFLNEFEWISNKNMRRVFNITREDGIGNWFSSTQTLLVSLTAFSIAFVTKSKKRIGWYILGFFFMFLSLDDGSRLHEGLGNAFSHWAESGGNEWLPSYGWQFVVGPILIAFAIYALWFLWKQLNKKELTLLILSFVILSLAIVLDFVEGMDLTEEHLIVHFEKVIEEFLEMFSFTILLMVFLKYLFRKNKKVLLEFKK